MIKLENISRYKVVSADTETTGLHVIRDSVFGVAIAGLRDDGAIDSGYWDIRDKPHVVKALQVELPKVRRLVNHNMKFDAHMLMKLGIRVPLDRIECTSVRAALINEHEPFFNLDALGLKYAGMGKETGVYEKLAALFGGKPTREVQMKNIHRAPERLVAEYATPDPVIAIKLWLWQEAEIAKQELTRCWALERDVLETLVEVEQQGIRVDEDLARSQLVKIDVLIDKAQRALDAIAGKPTNANSAPQMRALFKVRCEDFKTHKLWFTDLGFQLETTDGGEASVGKKSLEAMARLGDDRAKAVTTLRKYIKSTQFLKDHILGHSIAGRVYPNYNQTRGDNELGTGTGRFSINDPALQQIPARDRDIAALVRPCFLPERGHRWGCPDWAQFEFRWFAHYTQDPTIIEAYKNDPDTDYHAVVSKITGIPRNATHAGAANAKQINLGLVFGMGEGEMAYQMGLDYTTRRDERGREWKNAGPRAKAVFQTYHGGIPGVRQLLDKASSIARSRGYVVTVMGRHLRFPGGKFTHKAAGLVFQGTSADCLKLKMVELHRLGKQEGFRYLLPVHDENNVSLPDKRAEKLAKEVKRRLELFDGKECPIECRVPIRCSIKLGANWHEASAKE